MTQIISEESRRKLEQHFIFIDQQPAQVCTSAGNIETGSPLYSDGRIWTVTEGNNMPVLTHNGLAADDMVGHWVLVGEHRFSGERHVLAVLTDRNREKGGADFAAHAAAGPTESPDTRLPRNKYDADAAPTVNDDSTGRWTPASLWGGNSLGALYGLLDNTATAAVWHEFVFRTLEQTLTNKTFAAGSGSHIDATLIDSGILPIARIAAEVTNSSTGNLDDVDAGTAPVTILRMTNASSATIRGFANGATGRRIIIISAGAGNVFLAHQNAGSTDINRLANDITITAGNAPLAAGKGVAIVDYDATSERWVLTSHFQGEGVPFTPTWATTGTPPTLGNATLTGSYFVRGKLVKVSISFTFGSTSNGGTGTWTFSLPLTAASNAFSATSPAVDASVATYVALCVVSGGLSTAVQIPNFTAGAPFTWGTSDFFTLNLEYGVA